MAMAIQNFMCGFLLNRAKPTGNGAADKIALSAWPRGMVPRTEPSQNALFQDVFDCLGRRRLVEPPILAYISIVPKKVRITMDLIYRKEKVLFGIAVLISAVFWLVLVGATMGIALIYVLMFFVFYL
ncbi:MAG TPA: hypothetical protein VLG93_01405, partial [Sulfuricaulis sp.]|nr:hypothetical protein [Sulfuricaulis sp.]